MRVLHVTSTFPRKEGDPTGPFLADLVAAERGAGLDVRVLAPHGPGLAIEDEIGGATVRRFRYGPAVLAYRGGLLSAARTPAGASMVPAYLAAMAAATTGEVRSWQPDVVHAHWWLPAGLAAAVAERVTGRPFVVTLHGSDVAIAGRPALRRLAGVVLRRAAAVVAVSDSLAEEASAVLRLPVGVAVMPVVVGPPSSRPPRGGPVRLIGVGRLSPEKGFDILLEAVARAPGGSSLEVVGAGPEEPALRRQAAGLAVTFSGVLSRAALHARLGAADAVVVPSRREGLGLVAVEAVLLGTPVVASHVGGLPEALGARSALPGGVLDVPGGLLVPPGDVAALALAIERVRGLPPPSGEAMTGAERHRPERVGRRHVSLYEAAIRGDPRR